MVLGKLPVPGRPTIWISVGQGPTALAVGAGGGCWDIFTLIYPFSPLSPSILSQRAVKPKTTNQPIALAVGAGGGCLDIFTLLYLCSSLSPSLWETA